MKKHNFLNSIQIIGNIIAVLIIGGFIIFSAIIGGSADYIEMGKYYVSNHAEIIEVSKTVYWISAIWESLYFIYFPVYFIGACILSTIENKMKRSV